MTLEEYYGDALPRLREMERCLLGVMDRCPVPEIPPGVQPILYCTSRIKKPESMMRKLESWGLPTDPATALARMHDGVGMRIVCSFADDVYGIADWLSGREEFRVVEKKDYIAYPKPNGYRSLHLIVAFPGPETLRAEIQLRTIGTDFWAALEHQMKYKRRITHEKTIQDELKRCADEIASVDVSMQTLRDILLDDRWG